MSTNNTMEKPPDGEMNTNDERHMEGIEGASVDRALPVESRDAAAWGLKEAGTEGRRERVNGCGDSDSGFEVKEKKRGEKTSSLLKPSAWKKAWRSFTKDEKRNSALFIGGLMCYKLGYEAFVGSITTLALQRWPGDERYGKLGALHGLNMLFQCIGSILSSLILRRHPIRTALTGTVLMFALPPIIIMISDVATGGKWIKPSEKNAMNVPGRWHTEALFPLYCVCGICYGIIELVKRVIPRHLVGGDIDKLRQVDSVMHIFYEAAGTGGAFLSSFLLLRCGSIYSMLITPICFSLSAVSWFLLSPLSFKPDPALRSTPLLPSILNVFRDFFASIALGARIIFTSRRFCWLPIGYSLALYAHRYLENGLVPIIAQGYFKEPAYAQIMVGGSNLGELLGALMVLLVGNRVRTPVPWIRLDAGLLMLVWVLAFYRPVTAPGVGEMKHEVVWAWKLAPVLIPISLAWAAGDVSLVAFIQASLDEDSDSTRISALASVMAFLYSIYILLFAVLTPALGVYADDTSEAGAHKAVFALGGIQYSVIAVVLIASTFVMKGGWGWNPRMLEEGRRSLHA